MNGELSEISWAAVLAASLAAFVVSMVWYAVFGAKQAQLSGAEAAGQTPPWKLAVEVLRSLTVATVVAGLAAVGDVKGGVGGGADGARALGRLSAGPPDRIGDLGERAPGASGDSRRRLAREADGDCGHRQLSGSLALRIAFLPRGCGWGAI